MPGALLLTLLAASDATPAPTELWAGHQVVVGSREVPVIGALRTQLDTFVLATVTRTAQGGVTLEQRACATRVAPVFSVDVSMSSTAIGRLPTATIVFTPAGDALRAAPWQVGWDAGDLDDDGHPGLSVQVSAPLCSGAVYVASRSRSSATAKLLADGLHGSIEVRVWQQRLGASRFCLTLGDADTEETQRGAFAYRRVASTTRCEDLSPEAWPVIARLAEEHTP